MDAKLLDEMIKRSIDALPEKVKAVISNVVFVIDKSEDGELLGHYHGVPNTHRSADYFGAVPDQITLYEKIMEREAEETGEPMGDVVCMTLWHEIGHYLGFDEEGVEELEEKWRERFLKSIPEQK